MKICIKHGNISKGYTNEEAVKETLLDNLRATLMVNVSMNQPNESTFLPSKLSNFLGLSIMDNWYAAAVAKLLYVSVS